MKYIVLSCLLLSSMSALAESLNDIMIRKFGVDATPHNILYARTAEGKSILHIIPSEAACTKDKSEICNYAKAMAEIPEQTLQELKLALEQEGNSLEHHMVKIQQHYPGPQTTDNLDTFLAVARFCKENRQEPKPIENCSWDKHPYRDGSVAIGGLVVGIALAQFITYIMAPVQAAT